MVQFINWLYFSFNELIVSLTTNTVKLIDEAYGMAATKWGSLSDLDFKLVIFSETPMLDINLYDALLLFFGVFYTVIFVVIVYKIVKKVFVKITGWKKW